MKNGCHGPKTEMLHLMVRKMIRKIILSFRSRKPLDSLLMATPEPMSLLRKRTHWFFDLLEWIRHEGELKHDFDFSTGAPQAARVRYLLQVLDRQPEWKSKVARLLRSLVQDTHGLELFLETGISSEDSFAGELLQRLLQKIIPQAPHENELSFLFNENFRSKQDLEWIRLLDSQTFQRILDLFLHEISDAEKNWNTLKADAEKALLLLAIQIQGLGLKSQIRQRLSRIPFEELPFFQLPKAVELTIHEQNPELRKAHSAQIDNLVELCFEAILEVQQNMDEFGVSIHLVYQMEKMEGYLRRIGEINILLHQNAADPIILSAFVESLIFENSKRHSLGALFNQNFSLLARKIVERTAETGEHYITRNPQEQREIFLSSVGGGWITSFTILFKVLIGGMGLSEFYAGTLASINYSISFLGIHFSHWTLGTKQPALTAPALAAKMQGIRDHKAMVRLVDEIIHIIRSQTTAVAGNLAGVIPFTMLIGFAAQWLFNVPLMGEEKALHTLHEFSILGPTPLFAAFTGILLWLSSLISGWADNWFAIHRMSQALAHNRRLNFIFGDTTMRRFALFLKKHIAAIAANVSLGFLLGLTPSLLHFIGIGLEVRHVTLSSGSLAAALLSLPASIFQTWMFWSAVLGILSMAILNLLVSFSLALFLAIRARHIQAPERRLIYQKVMERILSRPLDLFRVKSTST